MVLTAVFLLLTAVASIHASVFQGWVQMPGHATDISSKGPETMIIGNDGKSIWRWNGKAWDHVIGEAIRVAASPDGWNWAIGTDNKQYRWNIVTKVWDMIGPGHGLEISAASRDQALVIGYNKLIAHYRDGWQPVALPHAPNAKSVGMGHHDEIWYVGENKHIYRFFHYRQGNPWDWIYKADLVQVDIVSVGRLVAVDDKDGVWLWLDQWVQLPGQCKKASINHDAVYCLRRDNTIWRGSLLPPNENAQLGWTRSHDAGSASDITSRGAKTFVVGADGNSLWDIHVGYLGGSCHTAATTDGWHWNLAGDYKPWRFNVAKQVWEQMPGPAFKHLSAASKDRALACTIDHRVWLWDGSGEWKIQPELAMYAGIGQDDERWIISGNYQMFRWNHGTGKWDAVGGIGATLDVYDRNRVVHVSHNYNVWSWEKGGWVQVPGQCIKASINKDELWCVGRDRSIWRRPFPSQATVTQAPAQTRPTHPPPKEVTQTLFIEAEPKVQVLVIDENDPRLADILAELAKGGMK